MMVSVTAECPCWHCEDRSTICHTTCEKYIEYKKTLDRNREKINAEKEEQEFMLSVKQRIIQAYIRHRGHKKGDKE